MAACILLWAAATLDQGDLPMSVSKWFAAAALASTLAACGGANAPPSTPRPLPHPTTFTVSGRAVNVDGLPVSGVTAVIGDRSVNVGSTGEFSISGVRAPYDLIVFNGTTRQVIIYRGLTRKDPTIAVPGADPISGGTATISGTVTGGHYPQQAGEASYVSFMASQAHAGTPIDGTGPAGTFKLPVTWGGATTVTGHLHAFQYTSQGGLPSNFTDYGNAPVTLSDGGSFTPNINLTPITSDSITGTVALPGAYSVFDKMYTVHLDGARALSVEDATHTTDFAYVVPNIAGARFSALAMASDPAGNIIIHSSTPVAAGNSIQLAPRVAPELILPANEAQDVDLTTSFSWSAFSEGVHEVTFSQWDGMYYVTVVTSDDSITLPDLSALGISLPRGGRLFWSVVGVAPVASMDEAASETFADLLSMSPKQEAYYGFTGDRAFTTVR
jgi:hypothetical protein